MEPEEEDEFETLYGPKSREMMKVALTHGIAIVNMSFNEIEDRVMTNLIKTQQFRVRYNTGLQKLSGMVADYVIMGEMASMETTTHVAIRHGKTPPHIVEMNQKHNKRRRK